jgi:hypothetical protein
MNFKKEILSIAEKNNDSIFWCKPALDDLDRDFNSDYGSLNGDPFIAYGSEFIYFPVKYDGAEWVTCVPRTPDFDFEPFHVGGG